MMIVIAEKISKGSFFKIMFTGFSLGLFVFFLVCGIAAMFGAEIVHWANQPVTGIKGLIVALLIWPVFSVFMTTLLWVFGILGLWLYSFYKPLKVRFKGKVDTQLTDA